MFINDNDISILQDSKVFVDMPLLHPVQDVIQKFESLPNKNKVVKNQEVKVTCHVINF